jgi:hypothetical protein
MMRFRASIAVVFGVCVVLAGVLAAAAVAAPSSKRFEIVPGSFHITPSTLQAGAHADLTTTFDFKHNAAGKTFNDLRTQVTSLPPGFIGSVTTIPTCTGAQLLGLGGAGPECPIVSQVGTISFDLTLASSPVKSTFPVYNMEVTSAGVAAELAFKAAGLTVILAITVRPGDSGLTVTSPSIVEIGEPHEISLTVWGVPGDASHDPERGLECFLIGEYKCRNGGKATNLPPRPFLSNPTDCAGAFSASLRVDSWEAPEDWSEAPTEMAAMTECERVPFDPSIAVAPTTQSAESPSGLDVSLLVPENWENPFSIATSDLKDVTVALPQGITLNPSAGSGLGACTPQEFEAETASSLPGEGCPPESKIGSIEIETPLIAEKPLGAVYVAKPYENPFGSLVSLYIVARIPDRGILVKVAGRVELNPVTGQVSTTFLNNPQVPFSRFTLKFRPGATAPLVSPPACGAYAAQGALTPWSAPSEPRLVSSTPFQLTKGVHEGACPSGGVPPFKPQVLSGTQNNDAGAYSPFYLRIIREDGEQEMTRFSTILPPGLTGNLTGIPFCSDAQIEASKHVSGTQETNQPSCPAASEIGHTIVGAGVGPVLAQTPGKVYLAGPYHGSALSIVSITSATVGPFDLGTVVIRFALRINPTTAQVEVDATGSDPIPHIIQGIVVHVRDIRVYMNRPKFILDPTNCNHMSITNTITGAGADFTNPADAFPVTVTSPFQATNCAALAFKPTFKVSTSGKTSRANGASLTAKLTLPIGSLSTQTNIARVKVDLPKQLPSRLTTLQKACTAAVFNANPAACPPASLIGHATATTPLIPVPLVGPAYFVSHGGEAFPSLIIVLQGYGITIDLVGSTFISKAGITSSTFKTVPDQPVGSFELTLPQGKFSALAANGNLCSLTRTVTVRKTVLRKIHGHTKRVLVNVKQTIPAALQMPTAFTAQNGATIHESTPVSVTGCAKAKPAAKKKAKAKKGKKK